MEPPPPAAVAPDGRAWTVHKFGGTSVKTAERYKNAGRLVVGETDLSLQRTAVVVSAMGGVTDLLLELVALAAAQDSVYLERLDAVRKRHHDCLAELFEDCCASDPTGAAATKSKLAAAIDSDVRDIRDILRSVFLSRTPSEYFREFVSGYGELWSAQILAGYLEVAHPDASVHWLDARRVITVKGDSDSSAVVEWKPSQKKMNAYLEDMQFALDIVVVTGYVASTMDGRSTTLKRNGSDFSAAIVGALLRAEAVTIWTDVDGVYSADPRRVPDAVRLNYLSYNEAMELAYFGAKVLHPHTMSPAVMHGIPLWIRSSLAPESKGTQIHVAARGESDYIVKGFSTIERVALVNVEGSGMIGVPGVCERLFASLREVGISVAMISQASSEHSICFVVSEADADKTKTTVEHAFFRELHYRQIETVEVTKGCAVLAVVGDGMNRVTNVAGTIFAALGKAKVNVIAIAQGSSERNISVVISGEESSRALRAVHSIFHHEVRRPTVALVGADTPVGKLVAARIAASSGDKFDVCGVAGEAWMSLFKDKNRNHADLAAVGSESPGSEPLDMQALLAHLKSGGGRGSGLETILVDCGQTKMDLVQYSDLLVAGVHVVTASAAALCDGRWADLRKALDNPHQVSSMGRLMYRAAMGGAFHGAQLAQQLPTATRMRVSGGAPGVTPQTLTLVGRHLNVDMGDPADAGSGGTLTGSFDLAGGKGEIGQGSSSSSSSGAIESEIWLDGKDAPLSVSMPGWTTSDVADDIMTEIAQIRV